MRYRDKLAVIFSVAMLTCATSASAQDVPPEDNDASYKLPLFIPKVAQPQGQKVNFKDDGSDNDEIYSLPKRAAIKPSELKPAAGTSDAPQKSYEQQYDEYKQQMKLYNEQMAEYRKQLATQQAAQGAAPKDNDSNYVLPGQYSEVKKTAKPKPAAPAPRPQESASPQQPVAEQPQYQPTPASQYNQRYNYSDQPEKPQQQQWDPNSMPYYYGD